MNSSEDSTPNIRRPGRPRQKKPVEATKTLDRGLSLLEQLGSESLTLSEIARKTSLHPSTASRLVRTLCTRGFVIYDESEGLYSLSSRFSGLTAKITPQQRLIEAARPLLRQLHESFDETAGLYVRREGSAVCLDALESSQSLRISTEKGVRLPLHATAPGKVLLAGIGEDRIRSLCESGGMETFTANTPGDVDALLEELRQVEERGYALEEEEHQLGVVSVAVPLVLDELPRAVVSISAPKNRLPGDRRAAVAERMLGLVGEMATDPESRGSAIRR